MKLSVLSSKIRTSPEISRLCTMISCLIADTYLGQVISFSTNIFTKADCDVPVLLK